VCCPTSPSTSRERGHCRSRSVPLCLLFNSHAPQECEKSDVTRDGYTFVTKSDITGIIERGVTGYVSSTLAVPARADLSVYQSGGELCGNSSRQRRTPPVPARHVASVTPHLVRGIDAHWWAVAAALHDERIDFHPPTSVLRRSWMGVAHLLSFAGTYATLTYIRPRWIWIWIWNSRGIYFLCRLTLSCQTARPGEARLSGNSPRCGDGLPLLSCRVKREGQKRSTTQKRKVSGVSLSGRWSPPKAVS